MDIRVLGNVEVHGPAGVVRSARAGERCVLAALAFSPRRPVAAATLADNIWSSAQQSDKAIETVADYVRKVRAAIKKAGGRPEWVRTDRGTRSYVLDVDPDRIDYGRFSRLLGADHDSANIEELRRALEQWQGRALADVTGLWAEGRRYAVEVERLNAYEIVLAHRLAHGHQVEVVRTVTELMDDVVPTDRLLFLAAQAMVGAGRGAAVRGWLDHAAKRIREATGAGLSPHLLVQVERLTAPAAPPGRSRPAAAPAMHGLRRDLAGFTGRQEESRRLLADVRTAAGSRDRAVAVHAVDGMAGIGKTTFCVHLAHQLADDFPDGQLFVELHGHTPGQRPVLAAEALESLLLATGLAPAGLPPRLDDRARLWRHRIAGKRLLLILDDAVDHDQIQPLLPGTPGSLVLITSRHRLAALDSALPVTLTVPSADEATQLLHRLAGITADRHDRDAVAEVVRACGHLPLAIAVVAGQLRNHPTWTIRHLADRLAAIDSRLDTLVVGGRSVAVAFDMSFTALSVHQQHLFRLLGAHAGPEIDAFAVAALLDSDLSESRRRLESMHADHLLDEVAPGRFQMHDLVRAYARHRADELDPQERHEAVARVLAYYLHTTIAATDHMTGSRRIPVTAPTEPPRHWPAIADDAMARAWLSRELPTLSACVERAAESTHDALAIELAAAMHPFLLLDAQWQRALAGHTAALTAAVRRGDRRSQAKSRHVLANAGRMICEFDTAAKHLADALALYTELGDQSGRAHVLAEMSMVRLMQGDYAGAVAPLTEAHDLFLALGNDLGRANAMKNLGSCHFFLGHFDLAASTLSEAARSFAELGEGQQQSDALRHLSALLRQRGEVQQAYDAAAHARRLSEDAGNRLGVAMADTESGLAQRDLGDHSGAMVTLRRAEKNFTALGFRPGATSVNTLIGTIHRAAGQYATATRLMTHALAEQHDLGVLDDELETLIELGALAGDYADAGDPQRYYRQALDIARQLGTVVHEARALAGLGQCLHRSGDPDARTLLRQALDIYNPLGLPEADPVAKLVNETE
jgi:tetratricopeptide (TPR) repeat protein/DNA-binding SARP family transcriptional activator